MTQKSPKRDIRLRKNSFGVKIGFDVPYERMLEILAPTGLPKLYRIKDLIFTEDLIVNKHLRPGHAINNRGSACRLVIKRIHIDMLDIELSADKKVVLDLMFTVYHWTRLIEFDTIGFREKLLLFFENKIQPHEVLILQEYRG